VRLAVDTCRGQPAEQLAVQVFDLGLGEDTHERSSSALIAATSSVDNLKHT
jgi:hypothetical protein